MTAPGIRVLSTQITPSAIEPNISHTRTHLIDFRNRTYCLPNTLYEDVRVKGQVKGFPEPLWSGIVGGIENLGLTAGATKGAIAKTHVVAAIHYRLILLIVQRAPGMSWFRSLMLCIGPRQGLPGVKLLVLPGHFAER